MGLIDHALTPSRYREPKFLFFSFPFAGLYIRDRVFSVQILALVEPAIFVSFPPPPPPPFLFHSLYSPSSLYHPTTRLPHPLLRRSTPQPPPFRTSKRRHQTPPLFSTIVPYFEDHGVRFTPVKKIFELFDVKQKGVINFDDFVRALNVFHPNAPQEEKIDFSFRLYDMDGTGFIERQEASLSVILADSNQDGKIDKSEWHNFVGRNPSLLKIMTLSYLRSMKL
ncbi:uncharacterized protein LOC132613109 [Lycium barbarum]|uniref:uncharacterized protein LOC132613109 n=1 Tax=Lycium barbarum TaxID=112863 RepID=UPI00293E43D0|nr:uncharacterized protein LOC132613109 [Lycium barbarum]